MVQYIVKSKDKVPKWTIVELQGKLEVRNGTQDGRFDGRYFGDLHFDASNTPILILGHHILQGKIIKLDKPFAVIEKEDKQFNVKGKILIYAEHFLTYFIALVKEKIIFKSRPKPIITHVPTKL